MWQKLKIEDYCKQIQKPFERKKSRVLILKGVIEQEKIFEAYGKMACKIRISDFVTTNGFFTMPSRLFNELEGKCKKICRNNQIPFIIGLEGYLAFLQKDKHREVFGFIKGFLDSSKQSPIVFNLFSGRQVIQKCIINPRYYSGQNIIEILSNGSDVPYVLPKGLLNLIYAGKMNISSLPLTKYLKQLEDGRPENIEYVTVAYNNHPFPGILDELKQLVNKKDILLYYYNIDWVLSDSAEEWLITHLVSSCDVRTTLCQYFFPNGMNTITYKVILVYNETTSTVEIEIFHYFLKAHAPKSSYLFEVVSDERATAMDLMNLYICKAIEFVGKNNCNEWILERQNALKALKKNEMLNSYVEQFIELGKTKSLRDILPWLNLGLTCEKIEFTRRAMLEEGELPPVELLNVFPELNAYLKEPHSGVSELDKYFKNYVHQKIKNDILPDFLSIAKVYCVPDSVERRDSLLRYYRGDTKSFLIIVDAMGAEYIPMIITLAQQRKLGIKDVNYAKALLPSSTQFNQIEFPNERVKKLHGLDNILHYGVKPHGEPSSDQENFAGELLYISSTVMQIVADKLRSNERVILSSDHGSTRLAVLAYQRGLADNIEIPQVIVEDWRYARNNSANKNVSLAHVKYNHSGEYLSIRGYNRFSRQGRGKFEIHGGATIEEQVIPFIVFERGTNYFVPETNCLAQQSQIEENEDFDI